MEYWRYGNYVSIASNIVKVMHTINKEDKNDNLSTTRPVVPITIVIDTTGLVVLNLSKNSHLMVLPAILGMFIPSFHYTPQGLVVKADKNDRLIWDGSHLIFYYSVCVNINGSRPRANTGLWDHLGLPYQTNLKSSHHLSSQGHYTNGRQCQRCLLSF